ncbi:MAG TPA: ATP-binding protein [Planctomycetes bacterium]|nr:ATP-binding protein [Planctomycetota bacterium]
MARAKKSKEGANSASTNGVSDINPARIFAVGIIGTGKTTTIGEIVGNNSCLVFSNNCQWQKLDKIEARPDLVPEAINRFNSGGRICLVPTADIETNEVILTALSMAARNTVVFIDDLRDWTSSRSRVKFGLAALFGRCRKNNVDLIIAAHNFDKVPTDLIDYKPTFLIKETATAPSSNWLNKFPNSTEFGEKILDVNRRAKADKFAYSIYQPF